MMLQLFIVKKPFKMGGDSVGFRVDDVIALPEDYCSILIDKGYIVVAE